MCISDSRGGIPLDATAKSEREKAEHSGALFTRWLRIYRVNFAALLALSVWVYIEFLFVEGSELNGACAAYRILC